MLMNDLISFGMFRPAEFLSRLSSIFECAGLLNVDEHDFVSNLLRSTHDSFVKCVLAGELDKARLLLRFLASLVVVQVMAAG
jgi:hypothetical protein